MKRLILAMLLLPSIFIACSQAKEENKISEVTISEPVSDAHKGIKAEESESKNLEMLASASQLDIAKDSKIAAPEAPSTPVPVAIDWDKKIIKNATVKLEVKDYSAYSQGVRNTVKKYGGYIAKEENFNTDEKSEAVLVVKVPVASFEQLLNELPAKDANQLERSITTEDVTTQMIDTKARLETKKATRDKYVQFLKQGKNVEDVLNVQSEINNIQEEIESAESRLAYLGNEAKFSTINLTFFEAKNSFNYNEKPSFGSRLISAFTNGGKWFADLFIGLLSIWPLYFFVALIYIIFKKFRRPRVIKKFE